MMSNRRTQKLQGGRSAAEESKEFADLESNFVKYQLEKMRRHKKMQKLKAQKQKEEDELYERERKEKEGESPTKKEILNVRYVRGVTASIHGRKIANVMTYLKPTTEPDEEGYITKSIVAFDLDADKQSNGDNKSTVQRAGGWVIVADKEKFKEIMDWEAQYNSNSQGAGISTVVDNPAMYYHTEQERGSVAGHSLKWGLPLAKYQTVIGYKNATYINPDAPDLADTHPDLVRLNTIMNEMEEALREANPKGHDVVKDFVKTSYMSYLNSAEKKNWEERANILNNTAAYLFGMGKDGCQGQENDWVKLLGKPKSLTRPDYRPTIARLPEP